MRRPPLVAGDVISFEVPIAFRLTRYTGVDQAGGRERHLLEDSSCVFEWLGQSSGKIV